MKTQINYTRETVNIWFPDQKEPLYNPTDPADNVRFKNYWRRERERCLNGFELISGIRVSGWLYWHTVYWKIKMSTKVNGRTFPVIETPLLRDIDWEAAENFERALNEGVFIELVGSRGFGKTVWQASRAAWYFTFVPRSQVVVSAGNSGDIKTVTDMIRDGLLMIHPIWKKQWLKKDWKVEILAGFKTPDGQVSEKSSFSQILMKNYQDGNDSMAINGTRPIFHIIDEIGKIPNFIKCVRDSDGCYWANQEAAVTNGVQMPTCLPMYTGTGGDMEKGKDAAEMFRKPRANHLLAFDDKWEGTGEIGWFMPVTRARMEYKEPMGMDEFLGCKGDEKLSRISILVSNEERCLKEWWEPRYEEAKSSGNSTTLLSFLAYWPIKPSHAFLKLTSNNFNIEAAKTTRQRIWSQGKTGSYVELYNDGESIKHKFVDKLPITEFPVKGQSKDAPIVIYEFPMQDPPYGLYVGGVDPYRQGKAKYSDSLGAVYIVKRNHDLLTEAYQDIIVASYVARPDNPDTFNEQARLLLKYYNARTLVENDELSFINFMKEKNEASLYLEPQPIWLKEISPNSDVNREYGIHRSSERVRDHLIGAIKRYTEDVIVREKDDQDRIIREVLGMNRIPDPMLLTEIIEYSETEGNFDRVIALSLALAMAEALNGRFGPVGSSINDERINALYRNRNKKRDTANALFGGAPRIYKTQKRGSKLFM